MHRTLKAETAKPPRGTLERQQAAFDEWRWGFNHERPHEALAMAVPADIHQKSLRTYPEEVADPEYPNDFDVRRLRSNGRCNFNGVDVHFGGALGGEAIGFEPFEDGVWQTWFGPIYLGLLTEHQRGRVTLAANTPYEEEKTSRHVTHVVKQK